MRVSDFKCCNNSTGMTFWWRHGVYMLQGTELLFNPSLDYGAADGFYDIVDGLCGEIFKQSSKIDRVAKHGDQEHYQVCIMHIGNILSGNSETYLSNWYRFQTVYPLMVMCDWCWVLTGEIQTIQTLEYNYSDSLKWTP